MIIVVTGMMGIDKKQYLAEVCEYAAQRGLSAAAAFTPPQCHQRHYH
jgi:nucleoside-triphosphatase THEP1